VGWIGRHCIALLLYLLDVSYFLTRVFSIWKPYRQVFNQAVYSNFIGQMVVIGVNTLATISFLAILVGIGVTSQLIYIMEVVTGAADTMAIIARLVLSEMGPLATGFVLVGRSCTAIVVDLGNTKVRGEIEPLVYMGINTDDYLVIPRVLAMIVSQTALAFYFSAIMIVFGVFFSAYLYDFSALQSLDKLLSTITLSGVFRFLVKNIFFGLIIGILSCFHGLAVDNSPIQVHEQMQRAVIRCMVFLFVADGYFVVFTL